MHQYRIDGATIFDLQTLGDAIARAVGSTTGYFGRDLQSLDDCLFGGFGLTAPCEIIWQDSKISRQHLDAAALVRMCDASLLAGDFLDTDGERWLSDTRDQARRGERTLFDEIEEMIRSVSQRSSNPDWKVELTLL